MSDSITKEELVKEGNELRHQVRDILEAVVIHSSNPYELQKILDEVMKRRTERENSGAPHVDLRLRLR